MAGLYGFGILFALGGGTELLTPDHRMIGLALVVLAQATRLKPSCRTNLSQFAAQNLPDFGTVWASSPPEKSGCGMYTQVMQNLQSVTKGVLKRVEEVTGKSIQFMRDDNS